MLSNFHVQIKQKTSYFAIAILLISVLFASCVLPSLKFGSASIEMNIAIPQYMEKTAKIDSSARFIHPDAEKLVVSIEASDMDTATYEFSITTKVNKISIKDLAPGKNRTITVKLYNKNANNGDQVLAENNKIVDIKAGPNNLSLVLKPVYTDDSFETNELTGILGLEIANLTGLAGKTQVYDFDIEFAGDYEIKAEFTDDNGKKDFAFSLNIYDADGKKVDESEGIYNLKSGTYFFVVSTPKNATSATFTVVPFFIMLSVPAGSFQRDATATNISVITKPYSLSKYQITRQQFEDVMGKDPSDEDKSFGMNDPVQRVNWYHAIAFCNKLSLKEGLTPAYSVKVDGNEIDWKNLAFDGIPKDNNNDDWDAATCDWEANGYRLPTEMEWMWAAIGADKDARAEAIDAEGINRTGYTKNYAGSIEEGDAYDNIDDYAWHPLNSGDNGGDQNLKTHPVGQKLPNELGLHDMSGNVWEWCWDWEDDYPEGTQTDYKGGDVTNTRILRGCSSFSAENGSWSIADRFNYNPDNQNYYSGFRVARNGN
ncbi:MAG TPA: hypothetical protein DDW88_08865 [Treponema sp.]|nr:hypothetical protein [Treponema sp.]